MRRNFKIFDVSDIQRATVYLFASRIEYPMDNESVSTASSTVSSDFVPHFVSPLIVKSIQITIPEEPQLSTTTIKSSHINISKYKEKFHIDSGSNIWVCNDKSLFV